jgi:hypothetical protein
MKLRRNSGATLAFVAGSIIFIVIVALAFYFLSQLLGGGRELQAATNSGSLNVAKQSILTPKVSVPSGDQTTADMKEILLGVLPNDEVNLLSFNRMVGAAMLVALNAEADGNASANPPGSLKNAATFIDLVEGSNGGGGGAPSAGQSLKSALANGSGWAQKFFNDTANGNSLRMLGDTSTPTWQAADFQVGYFAATQPANISVNNLRAGTTNNLPFTNIAALGENMTASALSPAQFPKDTNNNDIAKKDPSSNDTLILGYTGMDFKSVGRRLFAVPLDPQPHLVSLSEFKKPAVTSAPPGASDGMVIPPNAFMNGAIAKEQRKQSQKDVHMLAAAMAGTNQRPFEVSMPYGYIVLDNHLKENMGSIKINPDTVFANELGAGIPSDGSSGYFEPLGANQIKGWHDTPRDVNPTGHPHEGETFDPERDGPPWDKIFNNKGEAPNSATEVSNKIPYKGNLVTCTHSNSDAGGSGKCQELATVPPGGEKCPFDKAFYPNSQPVTMNSEKGLTAAERTGCKVMEIWQEATNTGNIPNNPNFNFRYTGLGLYPPGHNPIKGESVPWSDKDGSHGWRDAPVGDSYSDPKTPCKVTRDGNYAQLIDQTVGGNPDYAGGKPMTAQSMAVERIIKQRMHEILPADNAVIDAEYNKHALKPIPLGDTLYIYLDPAKNFKEFTSSKAAPPWVGRGQLQSYVHRTPREPGYADTDKVDGKDVRLKEQTYGIAMTMADPKYQWGIHEAPFIHVNGHKTGTSANPDVSSDPNGNGAVKAIDRVWVNANSGAFGNLLNITFEEQTVGQANVQFTDRD